MDATEKRMHDLMTKHLHPNLWGNIRTAYLDGNKDPVGANGDYKIKYLTGIFDDRDLRKVKEAIDNKQSIMIVSMLKTPQSRLKSINVEMGEDGVLRGWYSSEYQGSSHGLYYLLVDYNKATFIERD